MFKLLKLLFKKRKEVGPTPEEREVSPQSSEIEDNNRDKQPYKV